MRFLAGTDIGSSEGTVAYPGKFQGARRSGAGSRHGADARQLHELASPTPLPEADWIVFDRDNVTPVVDDFSRYLCSAGRALQCGEERRAAAEMAASARELRAASVRAGRNHGAAACIDAKLAQMASWRLASSAVKLNIAAQTLESARAGHPGTLGALLDASTCADIECRWLVIDEQVWFPLCVAPQRHFGQAVGALDRHDPRTVAAEIRKANGYMRLEAARATGFAKRALGNAIGRLGEFSRSLELESCCGRDVIASQFAFAILTLSSAHRANSSHWWAGGGQRLSGYALKAAARCLEAATAWIDGAAGPDVRSVVTKADALGAQLIFGHRVAKTDVVTGWMALGDAVERLDPRVGVG